MERVPIKTNPKMFDLEVSKIQKVLADELPWLDHSIGICETLTDIKDGKKFTSANLYIGKGKYELVMPCKELGNFSFFYLKDPQTIDARDVNRVKSPFSLIIWYDMRNVSLAEDERNREAIKGQIMGVLNSIHWVRFTINRIYENPKNIFTEYTYEHTDNQFLMSPYAGLRIEGEIETKVPCNV